MNKQEKKIFEEAMKKIDRKSNELKNIL